MQSRHRIRTRIETLQQPREGSLYPDEFEAGMVLALLWVLDEAPPLETREQLRAFIATRGAAQ